MTETKEKMTIRDFLSEVVTLTQDNRQDLSEFARHRIEMLDKQNKERKSKRSKTTEENEEKLVQIKEVMEDQTMTVKEIRDILENQDIEINSSKITAILKVGVDNKTIEKIVPEKRNAPLQYKVVL